MTEERLKNLDPKLVYEWVKSGYWNMKDFLKWVEIMKSKEE
jgi:hypothetical protein